MDNYIEILEKYVNIDWNNKEMYEKMLKELFNEYELKDAKIGQ